MKNETFAMKTGVNETETFHISEESARLPCNEKETWWRKGTFDLTRDGGFPPLLIDPIDFTTMYQQQLAAAAGQSGQQPNA